MVGGEAHGSRRAVGAGRVGHADRSPAYTGRAGSSTTTTATSVPPADAVPSAIDQQAKPRDVYAVGLRARQAMHVEIAAAVPYFDMLLAPPAADDLIDQPGIPLSTLLCTDVQPCRKNFLCSRAKSLGAAPPLSSTFNFGLRQSNQQDEHPLSGRRQSSLRYQSTH